MVTTQSAPEQRMVLHHVSWETYQRLLEDYADSSAPRFTYDRGTLEIEMPGPEHEMDSRFIDVLLLAIEERTGTKAYSFGSTTFSRDDLQQGLEPDACFYIQSARRVLGKARIDLHVDPPPDLAVEIDVSHASLDKLPIYTQMGIPEVWRYRGGRMSILVLEAGQYVQAARSRVHPLVTAEALSEVVHESKGLSQLERLRKAQEWARGLSGTADR